jgi:hypothetical protein
VPELPIFIRFRIEPALDASPVSIIDLEIFTITSGAIAKDAIYLESRRTLRTLELSVHVPLDVPGTDCAFSGWWARLVCDALRSLEGILKHLLYFVDGVGPRFLDRGLLRIFYLRRGQQTIARESITAIRAMQVVAVVGDIDLEVLLAAQSIAGTAHETVTIGGEGNFECLVLCHMQTGR